MADLLKITNIADIKAAGGDVAGVSQLFTALRADIATFPVATTPIVNIEDHVTLTGDFIMEIGKVFTPVYLTGDQGKIENKGSSTNMDSTPKTSTLDLFFPRFNPVTAGFIVEVEAYPDRVWIAVQCGQMFVYGLNTCHQVRLTEYTETTGQDKGSDSSSITYQLKQTGELPKFYTGLIPLV